MLVGRLMELPQHPGQSTSSWWFPSVCMPVCLYETDFLRGKETQVYLPQEEKSPQSRVRIVPTSHLVNQWAFVGVTNRSMGDGLFIGPGVTQKQLYHQKKPTPTPMEAHKRCNPGAFCTPCRQLHRSEKSLYNSAAHCLLPHSRSLFLKPWESLYASASSDLWLLAG